MSIYDIRGLVNAVDLSKEARRAYMSVTAAMHSTMDQLVCMAVACGANLEQCLWAQYPTEYHVGLGDFSDEIERYELQVDDEVWAIMRVERRSTGDPFVLKTVITKEWTRSVSE